MKKSFIYLVAILATVMLSACSNNDEPVNKQSFSSTINTRYIHDQDITFSQGMAGVELNYTAMTIKISGTFKDAAGLSHTVTTSEMKMNAMANSIYSFNNDAATGNVAFENFNGSIDLSTGVMYYSFTIDDNKVFSTTHLLYAYVTTAITNPGNGFNYDHDNTAYLFIPESDGKTCTLRMSNFTPNVTGTIQEQEIEYKGLTMTPTATGYTVTADEAESSYAGFYTITDLQFTLNGQGRIIDGTFKCNDLDFKVAGNMFVNSQSSTH